ncbi:hypothetical protein [Vagococcus acidifermentans]|uniref:Uncharacterized protein n=1 Tax=Vagococcus acidifermentans TaxID=564710 RepID=A0A430B0W0_9ENTE|nr:hypothetical protein [Vagococcus acidifermentans]RSU13954.1 hypothetical protein CBF27_03370 [Vagococcus acidifermentans]
MSIFTRLFGRKKSTEGPSNHHGPCDVTASDSTATEWEELPEWSQEAMPEKEKELVAVLAASIAAGNQAQTELSVTRIWARNPEFQLVAALSSAVAAFDNPGCQYVIKSIKVKKQEEQYVKKV